MNITLRITMHSEIPKDLRFHRPSHYIRPEFLVSDSKYSNIYFTKYQKTCNKSTIIKHCAAKVLKPIDNHMDEIEYHITKKLNHPNVIRPLGILRTLDHTIIFYPWMSGGSLMEWIDKKIHVSEMELSLLFRQMVAAVEYIHSQCILHQDIKPDNFLLTIDGHVKLADFGLARYNQRSRVDFAGSPVYMAPEVMMRCPRSYESDIWSLGICLYEMVYNHTPFTHVVDEHELLKEVQKPIKYPKLHISLELRDLLMRMLSFYTNCRIKVDAIKNHGWLYTSVSDKKVRLPRIPKSSNTL